MKHDIVDKWIAKAKNDLKTAKDELVTEDPATDTVCFHAQQCVEKYLKAYLIQNHKEISKTHDLALLLQMSAEIDKDFLQLLDMDLDVLTDYAVDVRYPDDFYLPSFEEADSVVKKVELFIQFINSKIQE